MINIRRFPSAIGVIVALATIVAAISSCGPSGSSDQSITDNTLNVDPIALASIPCLDSAVNLVTTSISPIIQDGVPVIYLSKTGCGLANGSSWDNAASLSFLKKADQLTKNVKLNKVLIMQGVYKPTSGTDASDATASFDFPLSSVSSIANYGVEYIGGFLGDSSLASASDPTKYPTIFCGRATAKNTDCSDGTNSNQIIKTTTSISLTNMSLIGGYTNAKGGAVAAGNIKATNVNFTNNKAKSDGGAIYTSSSAINSIVNYSNFENNESSTDGGAINGSNYTVFNSSFNSNKSFNTGGAIRSRDKIFIVNTSFSANNANTNGHAVYLPSGAAVISNSSFANHNNATVPTIYGLTANSILLLNSIVYDRSNTKFDTVTGLLAKTQKVFNNILLGGNSTLTDSNDKIINSDPKLLTKLYVASKISAAWYFPLATNSPAIAAGLKIWADATDTMSMGNNYIYIKTGNSYIKYKNTTTLTGWSLLNSTATEATNNTIDITIRNINGSNRDASPNIGPS